MRQEELLSEEIGESDVKAYSHLPMPKPASKSMEFSALEIESDFRLSCRQFREKHPKGWHGIVAGSIRRGLERVHDLDVVLVMEREELVGPIKDFFRSKATPWHCDYRLCTEKNKGAMLLYLTGDKTHNIAMRYQAAQKGLMLNEYGLWGRVHASLDNRFLVGDEERRIYERLGLCYLRPSERSFRLTRQDHLEVLR